MHGSKQLVYDSQPFFFLAQNEKTYEERYILWKQNKSDTIFLVLYTTLDEVGGNLYGKCDRLL